MAGTIPVTPSTENRHSRILEKEALRKTVGVMIEFDEHTILAKVPNLNKVFTT